MNPRQRQLKTGNCGIYNDKRRPPKVTPFCFQLERAMRFELTTLTLARLCSTPELRPLTNREAIYSAGFAGCKREMKG